MSNYLNISVKKLLSLPAYEFERYHDKMKYLVGTNRIGRNKAKILTELTFGQVIFIRKKISDVQHLAEVFSIVYGIDEKRLLKKDIISFYKALNWIAQEMEVIAEREKANLSSKPDPKWDEAGIDRLTPFGDLNTMINLAHSFPAIDIREVENMEYRLVFALRLHQKTTQEIEKAYHDIMKRENQSA